MTDPLDSLLARSRDAIRLTDAEKARGRALLTARMQANPLPVASPFMPWLSPWVRGGVLAVAFLMLGGSGVAAASLDALPHEPLYVVKVDLVEPMRLALTFDSRDRAALHVTFADTRLKELERASAEAPLSDAEGDGLAERLSAHIEGAQRAISSLDAEQMPAEALGVAAQLQATLDAHAEILVAADAAAPAADGPLDAILEILERESGQTEDLAEDASSSLETVPDSALAEPVEDSARELRAAFDLLERDIVADSDAAAESRAAIAELLAAGERAVAAGEFPAAARLLADADRKLTALRTTLAADTMRDTFPSSEVAP